MARLQRLYNWIMRLSHHRHARWYLAAISFAESSFSPILPDPMILTMCLADRKQAFNVATISTLSSVAGGFLGYYIGYALFETVGLWIVTTMSSKSAFDHFHDTFHQWGFLIIALKGFTPIPFKIVTITSGVVKFDLLQFTVASLIARGLRFYLVAFLLWRYGEKVKVFVESNLALVTMAGLAIIIIGFVLVKIF